MGRRDREDAGFELGDVEVVGVTERALRVRLSEVPDGVEDVADDGTTWIPKSQLHKRSYLDDTAIVGEKGAMVVSTWFAGQRGFL
jgi:hypothetical protein